MRIWVLATDAFGGYGGIAKYNRDLLSALCSYPTCNEVVAFPRIMPFPPENLPKKLKYLEQSARSTRSYIQAILKQMVFGESCNYLVCAHVNLLPLAVFIKWVFRSPLTLVVYGIDVWQPHPSALVRWCLRYVDHVISISEITKDKFIVWAKLADIGVTLLPNAIAAADYGPGVKAASLLERYGIKNKTVLLTVGRLSGTEQYKGVDEVMEVMPDLLKPRSDVVYLVVGDGSDRPRLQEKAVKLGVGKSVIFTGFIPESEKADHYRLADVFVMPGRGEGFGFVFLEAMACGVPVVASTLDGSREAVRFGQLGVLVNPDDKMDVLRGILDALSRPRGAVPEGLDYFSFEKFESRLHAHIDKVAKLDGHRR